MYASGSDISSASRLFVVKFFDFFSFLNVCLGVRHFIRQPLDFRLELRQVSRSLVRVINELAHIVGNDTHAPLALSLLLLAPTQENGDGDGQGLTQILESQCPFSCTVYSYCIEDF